MNTDLPLVSIIILNWNGLKYIHQCIDGVLKQTYPNIEVLFVDNASTDTSLIECKERYPSFSFIESATNLGFTGGMNLGIKHAKGDFVLLLNTDVYLRNDYVQSCVELMNSNPDVACTAGWEYKWRDFEFTDEKVVGAYGIRRHLRVVNTDRDNGHVFGVSGSFPIFRKSVVDAIVKKRGFFFDEAFETGWEDTEVRFYMLHTGHYTLLNKKTLAWHVGSASDDEHTGMFEKNLAYQKRIFRNRLYVIGRYVTGFSWPWRLYISVINMILFLYVLILQNKSLPSYFEAYKDYNRNKEHNKEQRRIVSENRVINPKDICAYFVGF